MKALIQTLFVVAFFSLVSCEKAEIPVPGDPPVTELPPPFYISGNFNGTQLTKVIDGDVFKAVTYVGPATSPVPQEDISVYTFELYNVEVSEVFPEITFSLYNHDFGENVTYDDLIESTAVNSLPLLNIIEPSFELLNHLIIDYIPEGSQYFSSFFSLNTPLTITESRDTTFNGISYRILGLEGNISLGQDPNEPEFLINDFEARIVFSL